MKILVASDIHGSVYYCKKMLDMFKAERANKLLLLGDVLYHGPRNDLPKEYNPKLVIEMLNGYKNNIICIQGNCDCDVDQMVLEFPIIPKFGVLLTDNSYILATHGHVFNPDNLPPLQNGDVFLYGHTHIPDYKKIGNITIANPGSVSLPKENSHNGYMIIENNNLIWKDFDGNVLNKKSIR